MAMMDYDDVDTAMDEYWRLHPAKAQFTRSGETSKWFRPLSKAFMGKRHHFKAYTTPMTSARSSDFATAAAGSKEFPAPQEIGYTELSYAYSDLTMIQLTVSVNEIAEQRTQDRKHAVYTLAKKMFHEADLEAGSKINMMLHQSSACQMALVSAVYDEDGTTYTGSNRYCFAQIKDGAIGKFVKGMVLDIGGESDYTVLDVIHGSDGPWSGGSRQSSIGPGLVLDHGSGEDCDDMEADDAIRMSDETTGDGFNGFEDWFSGITNVYKDSDGSSLDRDGKGYAWSIPEIYTVSSDNSTVFDMDQHLGKLAVILPQRCKVGRQRRALDAEEDIIWPSSLVAITTPEIAVEATRDAADQQRFTSATATSMDGATRKRLFGEVGFEGMVWHSMTLGSVAIQADPVASPYKVRILDPQSWNVLTLGEGMYGVQWLRQGGSRFIVKLGTNGYPTFTKSAGAWTAALLYCDQPGANAEIDGVTATVTI